MTPDGRDEALDHAAFASSVKRRARNRRDAAAWYEALDQGGRFQLAVAGTHTKIALLRTARSKIVMSGSANLRSSRSVEALTIERNEALYDFHLEWHNRILDAYGTVQKAIRAQALFDHLTD